MFQEGKLKSSFICLKMVVVIFYFDVEIRFIVVQIFAELSLCARNHMDASSTAVNPTLKPLGTLTPVEGDRISYNIVFQGEEEK